MKDAILVNGLKAAALPLGAGLLGLGIMAGGFFMYNKIDDVKEWVADNWEDGFGLVNDATQTQEQVGGYTETTRVPRELSGMSVHSIYQLHYDMRYALLQYFAQAWCVHENIEYTGPNQERFIRDVWAPSFLGTPIMNVGTFRFERNQVIQTPESNNEISEYVYQMVIRETDSRNTQARVISGLQGALSTGIGAAFSEATHWALRSSGFMRGSDGWDGQNWEEAPGANLDPLLMFAWARTDFQTGKWWSTVDSQGDVAFWMDRQQGVGGYSVAGVESSEGFRKLSYENIIMCAFNEMEAAEWWGPCLGFIAEKLGVSLQGEYVEPETPELTPEEIDQIEREGQQQQEDVSNESGRDDYMPGEEPPEDEEEQYGPPR